MPENTKPDPLAMHAAKEIQKLFDTQDAVWDEDVARVLESCIPVSAIRELIKARRTLDSTFMVD